MNTVATSARTALRVPLLDLRAQYQALKPQIMSVIGEVCDNQAFILGPCVKRLESGVAAYVQSRHGIGVSSGTDALLAIARRYGLSVVEDAAQAIGSECPGGRRAGGMGPIGCDAWTEGRQRNAATYDRLFHEGDCPEAERAAREAIALPVDPELRPEQIEYVVATIRQSYE